jgi:hypothetical protein
VAPGEAEQIGSDTASSFAGETPKSLVWDGAKSATRPEDTLLTLLVLPPTRYLKCTTGTTRSLSNTISASAPNPGASTPERPGLPGGVPPTPWCMPGSRRRCGQADCPIRRSRSLCRFRFGRCWRAERVRNRAEAQGDDLAKPHFLTPDDLARDAVRIIVASSSTHVALSEGVDVVQARLFHQLLRNWLGRCLLDQTASPFHRSRLR